MGATYNPPTPTNAVPQGPNLKANLLKKKKF
jgi:hypothetical protein